MNSCRMPPICCHINIQPRLNTYLKEPLGKRQCLARFFTSLASATLGTERERGDVDMCSVWASEWNYTLVRDKFLAVRHHYKNVVNYILTARTQTEWYRQCYATHRP